MKCKIRICGVLNSVLCSALFSVAFLSGCDLKKTADEMKSSTNEIRDISKDLSEDTTFLRNDLTEKESTLMVLTSLNNLFGFSASNDGLSSASDNGLKSEANMMVQAKLAVISMYFQYWKGGREELGLLDQRFEEHSEMFFGRVREHIPRDFQVDVTNPDAFYVAVASLGASLDIENQKYKNALKAADLPNFSFYEVIKSALQNRNDPERPTLLPRAEIMIRKFQRDAFYLLQLRHNYLPMMVLGEMTKLQDMGLTGRVWARQIGMSVDMGVDRPEDPRSVGDDEAKQWLEWLNMAAETRQALRDMGVKPEYNTTFNYILQGVDFGQQKILAMPATDLTPRQKLFRELAETYTRVVEDAKADLTLAQCKNASRFFASGADCGKR